MEIKKLTIQNFKGIKDIEINFEKNFNLIIGDNGIGKTSILDAISVSLGGFISGVEGVRGNHFTRNDVRVETKLLGDASYNVIPQVPVSVSIEAFVDGERLHWIRKKNSYLSSRSTIEKNRIDKLADKMSKDENKILPIINYQGASRMWSGKRNTRKDLFNNTSRQLGYIDSLTSEANNKMLLNWCRSMEQISWQEDKKISEYESVKRAVAKFMSFMNNSDEIKVFYDKKRDELVYREKNNVLPISFLSSGYQSLIWMVFDISYRMAILNPNLYNDVIEKTNGVVLIDELDVHLHPNWQWRVIKALQQTFPSVQFIATTHSPIMLTSTKNIHVISIDKNQKIDYKNNLYSLPLNQVLSTYQDSTEIPDEIRNRFLDFDNYLYQDINKATEILDDLKLDIGEINPLIHNAILDLEFQKFEKGEE